MSDDGYHNIPEGLDDVAGNRAGVLGRLDAFCAPVHDLQVGPGRHFLCAREFNDLLTVLGHQAK